MKKLNEFTELTEPSDDDLLLIWDGRTGTTKCVKLTTLKDYFGVAESQPSSVQLNYGFNGDGNGVFYYLGTNGKTSNWSNPHQAGSILISMSSFHDNHHNNPHFLVDRATNQNIATANVPNSWYKVNLGLISLIPNYYSIRNRDDAHHGPANWKLQASNDDSNWVDLDVRNNNPLSQNQWFSAPILNQGIAYKYFRLFQHGLSTSNTNYFCIGEFELYGTVK
jgi:E3 ubiquitin-protein ligase HECTD1